jgi:hypothetical protein
MNRLNGGRTMKVRFVQSGGYGGLVKELGLETANLAADEARTVEELVRNSGLSTSGAHFSASGRDLHQYDITIEDGAGPIEAT